MTILIFCELDHATLKKSSLELISKADDLKCSPDEEIILETLNPHDNAWALSEIITKTKPRIILASNSTTAKDIFPRIAARMKIGLATDVVDLKIVDIKLIAKKPLYAGKCFCDVHFTTDVQMALVRPNSFFVHKTLEDSPPPTGGRVAESRERGGISGSTSKVVLVETIKDEKTQALDIAEAEIIVAGGRGMGSIENFKILDDLAETLGGTVGASRAAVDAGFATHAQQVGQTGKVVSPKLYIACGISGAIQHWAGIRTAKTIVAINKDKDAPIFQKADFCIVGDVLEILPQLITSFKHA